MDPHAALRTLLRHKWVALPFVVLTVALFAGALFFGPRVYQATSSYAMITPAVPGTVGVPGLPESTAIADNPYLRSADPTLVLQVGKTRLASDEVTGMLRSENLSTDFVVASGPATSTQILTVTAEAADPAVAVRTAQRLGEILDQQIRQVQLVNGASDTSLITVQTINRASTATEKVSGRLRTSAVAGLGGVVLLIAAISVARALDPTDRAGRPRRGPASVHESPRAREATVTGRATPGRIVPARPSR